MKDQELESTLNTQPVIEALAEYAHRAWAGWTEWMFEKWDQTHSSGETFQTRWKRQIVTSYAELSEVEKDSDRQEARAMIAAIVAATNQD
jgi:hypothetical protein